MKYSKDQWLGNKWASIAIEPIGAFYFVHILWYLASTYDFPKPPITDAIDGYIAEFNIHDSRAIMSIDAWTFSIAFEDEAVRDVVLEALCELPDDTFD